MDVKASKDKQNKTWIDRENLIYIRWNRIKKQCTKTKKVIDRGKRSKTLSEVKPVENINKNLQSFLEISPVQEEVLLSHKLRDYAYEYQIPFKLKEDNASQSNCQNQLCHPGLSHIEQECQENLIQGKIHIQQN